VEVDDWRDCDTTRELPFKSFWIPDFEDEAVSE